MLSGFRFALAVCFLYFASSLAQTADEAPVRVFILAGQSNMQGQGVVDLDHPQYYNGGKGTLLRVMSDPANKARFAHVKHADGQWVVRDDVLISFRTKNEIKKGGLSIGFAGYPGKHHIGPEFQFGHVVGEAFDEPVLLIKTAWGGKSLFKDFRPPSADGETGPYYRQMVAEVREALASADDDFPGLVGRERLISGFVWMQGWNDMFNEQARAEYEQNLVHLINDMREEFKAPKLPAVIGELGNGGPKASGSMLAIRKAQKAAANRPEFKGTVAFVPTAAFARPAQESPNVGHGHHWFGNAESYFLIGDALGRSMLTLLGKRPRPDRDFSLWDRNADGRLIPNELPVWDGGLVQVGLVTLDLGFPTTSRCDETSLTPAPTIRVRRWICSCRNSASQIRRCRSWPLSMEEAGGTAARPVESAACHALCRRVSTPQYQSAID